MLLSELVRPRADRELESALRAMIAARRAGSITSVSLDQLAKNAGIDGLTKGSLERFLNSHPGIAKHVGDFDDNTIELQDPSDDTSDFDLTAPEGPDAAAEPGAGEDNLDSTDLGDFGLAPDAAEDPAASVDLAAGDNTGAPMTPDNRVSPTQGNGAKPKPKEYDQVQTAAQRALGRRS